MTFEDLKDRFKSEFQQLTDRIQETPAYLSLKDRYDTLPPSRQKVVTLSVLGLILVLVFSIPFSTYMASSENVAEYEEKKDLIRDLLRAHKEANESSLTVDPPGMDQVRAQADSAIQSLNLLPEQNRGIQVQPLHSPLIKSSIVEGVLEISTLQLNLRQVVSLATGLAKIPGAKLKDLIMNANAKDGRYFDTIFRVVVFKGEPPVEGGGSPARGSVGVPPPPPPPQPVKRSGQ